jgi:hypothetical protein
MPLLSHTAAGADGSGTPIPSQPLSGRCSPSQAADTLSTLGLETRGAWQLVNKSDVADLVDDQQRDAAELMGFPGGDLPLQAGGQELLVAPRLGAGPLGQPLDRGGQRRRCGR